MISIQITILCDLVNTESKPSNEHSTDVQNPFRLATHYHHSLFMENPDLKTTTSTYLNMI